MEVVDTQRLETAVLYLQRMIEGRNPVNNMPVDEDSVIRNPNVERCMLFVKEVLEEIQRNDGYIGRRPRKNKDDRKQDYPTEVLASFRYTEDKSITKLVEQFNELTDMTVYKKLTYEPFTSWLKKNGFLAEEFSEEEGKKATVVSDKGRGIGIKSKIRKNSFGEEYNYIIYGKEAQELLALNIDKILGKE